MALELNFEASIYGGDDDEVEEETVAAKFGKLIARSSRRLAIWREFCWLVGDADDDDHNDEWPSTSTSCDRLASKNGMLHKKGIQIVTYDHELASRREFFHLIYNKANLLHLASNSYLLYTGEATN